MNVTDSLKNIADDRIKVSKEGAGTSAFNKAYDEFQANQDKAKTRQILELSLRKVHVYIN